MYKFNQVYQIKFFLMYKYNYLQLLLKMSNNIYKTRLIIFMKRINIFLI